MVHEAGGFRTGYCPSCERYISSSRSCPYCDCDAYCPPALKLLRIGAALLASLGLLLLYTFSITRPIPTVDIAELVPMMNYAVVRLTGTVATKPYVSRSDSGKADYLAFTLKNDNGRKVRVQAYNAVAQDTTVAPPKSTVPVKSSSAAPRASANARVQYKAISTRVLS